MLQNRSSVLHSSFLQIRYFITGSNNDGNDRNNDENADEYSDLINDGKKAMTMIAKTIIVKIMLIKMETQIATMMEMTKAVMMVKKMTNKTNTTTSKMAVMLLKICAV